MILVCINPLIVRYFFVLFSSFFFKDEDLLKLFYAFFLVLVFGFKNVFLFIFFCILLVDFMTTSGRT